MNKELLNKEELEKVGRRFLELVDPNPDREGLIETPKRFAKYWIELLEGQLYTNEEIAKMFDKCFDLDENDNVVDNETLKQDLVVESGITIFSHCEHHLALMYDMDVTIAYIPNKKVIGLSKMARIAEMVGKRLQLQEKIGNDIADVMKKILGTEDVAVLIKGKHGCMTARGAKAREAITRTSSLSGRFMTNSDLRMEMLSLLKS
jgi:GTP cyclohydrolase I